LSARWISSLWLSLDMVIPFPQFLVVVRERVWGPLLVVLQRGGRFYEGGRKKISDIRYLISDI
jgi:hypothetical protein